MDVQFIEFVAIYWSCGNLLELWQSQTASSKTNSGNMAFIISP